MVWDHGTYRNLKEKEGEVVPMAAALEAGHAAFWLEGTKLKGGYALIRTGKGENTRWLLVKMDDDQADARRNPLSTEPASSVSGRTLEEIAQGEQ